MQDPLAALAGAASQAGVPGTRRFMSALDPRRFLQSVTVVPGAPDPLDQYSLGIVKAKDAWNVTQGELGLGLDLSCAVYERPAACGGGGSGNKRAAGASAAFAGAASGEAGAGLDWRAG